MTVGGMPSRAAPVRPITGQESTNLADILERVLGTNRGGLMSDVPASPTEPPRLPHEVSLADITERLMVEFGDRVSVSTVSAIVLECRHDLQGSPVLALPELVERLARQRLLHTSCAP